MRLSKRDKEFRLPKISYLDFKQLEMDRVLTALFARLKHDDVPSRLRRTVKVTSDAFVAEFLEHPEWFDGFDRYPDILRSWIETHLMDMVNRGKAKPAIAAPRPLHGYTYRFRNPKRSRDYGASQQVYETLYRARQGQGYKSIDQLKRFFFPGIDLNTDKYDASVEIDVETQALLRLSDQVKSDAPDPSPRDSFPPACYGAADLMADDVIRLLVYQSFIPRSVMVDYLKILLSFHLALYHLRLFKMLPILLRRRSADPTCAMSACPMSPRKLDDPHGGCPYRIHMLVDVANSPDTQMAKLAEASAEVHYRRIIGFLRCGDIRRHQSGRRIRDSKHPSDGRLSRQRAQLGAGGLAPGSRDEMALGRFRFNQSVSADDQVERSRRGCGRGGTLGTGAGSRLQVAERTCPRPISRDSEC